MPRTRNTLLGLATLALVLAACGQQLLAQPAAPREVAAIQAQNLSPGDRIRTVQADLSVNAVTRVQGLPDQVARPPVGVKVAYRFADGQVKMRIDAPGGNFNDGRGRVLTFDNATRVARVLFSDTLAADTAMNAGQLGAALHEQSAFASTLLDAANPYARQSASSFQQKAQSGGASTASAPRDDGTNGDAYTTASQNKTLSSGARQSTVLTFDSNVGAVTRVRTTVDTDKVNQSGTTLISYASVVGAPNLALPVQFTTQQTVLWKALGHHATMTQDMTYDNVAINTLPDSFFAVGGP